MTSEREGGQKGVRQGGRGSKCVCVEGGVSVESAAEG